MQFRFKTNSSTNKYVAGTLAVVTTLLLGLPSFAADAEAGSAQSVHKIATNQKGYFADNADPNARTAQSVMKVTVKAPPTVAWDVLTDFNRYPEFFKRIKTCNVIKKEGDFVYVESEMKPQLFVKKPQTRTVNDLKGKPHILDWSMLDGNFSAARGRWLIEPNPSGKSCTVTYTLIAEPCAVMPASFVSFFMKFLQKEIISQFKDRVEDIAKSVASAPIQEAERLPSPNSGEDI